MMFRPTFVPLAASLLLLLSCGHAGREETPAYFNAVTGLKLCENAAVENRHTAETDMAGTGVVYVVALRMTPACRADLLRQIEALQSRLRSQGHSGDDTSIAV